MENPRKSLLYANCIIRSCKTKLLYCSICTNSPSLDDWQSHIESQSHKMIIERFNAVYENRKTDLSCKICNKTLNWDQLKFHAIKHQLIPWYVPLNVWKLFFEHKILCLEKRYYCAACETAFHEWFQAVAHIERDECLKTIKNQSSNRKNVSLLSSNVSYQTLISDGLFSCVGSLDCNICSCADIGWPNIQQHIQGTRHSSLKLELTLRLNKILDRSRNNNVRLDENKAVRKIVECSNERVKKKSRKSKKMENSRGEKLKNKVKKAKPTVKHCYLQDRYLNIIMNRNERRFKEWCFDHVVCNICQFRMTSGPELHVHLARHIVEDLNNSEDDKIVSEWTFVNLFTFLDRSNDPEEEASDENLFYTDFDRDLPKIESLPVTADDYIYDMKEKLKELEFGLKLCFGTNSKLIYCFVCSEDKPWSNYYEHLSSREHCIYQEIMKKDHKLFADYPDEFSTMSLSMEYIAIISSNNFMCVVCTEEIAEDLMKDHIEKKSHIEKRDERRAVVMQNWKSIVRRFDCNWYKVENYLCVPCEEGFQYEINFLAHIKSDDHKIKIREIRIDLIFDFCEVCACLWYGYRQSHSYHCKVKSHLWLLKDGFYATPTLPLRAKELLVDSEKCIEDVILSNREKNARNEIVILDMETALKAKFGKMSLRAFDSRLTGIVTRECDVNVFVDCGNMYDENSSFSKKIRCMNDLTDCLKEYPEKWAVESLPKCSDIRIHHFSSGLFCVITYNCSLAIIKCFCDIYRPFQKMLIFLQEWTILCDSSIDNRIVYWQCIFYLQRLSILPSVGILINMKLSSDTIVDWEAEVARVFGNLEENHKYNVKKLLEGFFGFWAKFDYKNDVACPVIGKLMKKQDLAVLKKLSDKTLSRCSATAKLLKMNELQIPFMGHPLKDSPFGIQDPFDLQRNVAENVRKFWCQRFRTLASMSSKILENETMTILGETLQNSLKVLSDE